MNAMALRKCKECGQAVSSKATVCPQCGAVLKKQMGCGSGCLVLLILFAVLAAVGTVVNSGGKNHGGGTRTNQPADERITAWLMCQQFVKKRLKAPSTADFGSFFKDYQNPHEIVEPLGQNKFRIRAWVDSQNGFGATLRTYFTCELEHREGDMWHCVSLTFDE